MYWKEQKALLVADVHLGKISHFRKNGSALPIQAINDNFQNLNKLLKEFEVETLYVLGDLFHSTLNTEWNLFKDWVKSIHCKMELIAGNHDIINPTKYKTLGIAVHDKKVIDHFLLSHHPTENKNLFNICGHIHPAVKLHGKGKQRLKLSCFFKTQQQLILPAFGTFTGTYVLSPKKEDTIFAIVEERVHPLILSSQ